jgi:hypothetical protein
MRAGKAAPGVWSDKGVTLPDLTAGEQQRQGKGECGEIRATVDASGYGGYVTELRRSDA